MSRRGIVVRGPIVMRPLLGVVLPILAICAVGSASAQGPLSPVRPPSPPTPGVPSPATPSPTPSPAPTTTGPGSIMPAPPSGAPGAPSPNAGGANAGAATGPPDGRSVPAAGTGPLVAPGDGKDEPAAAHVYSLARCLALADARAPQIRMAEDRLAQAHAQLDEIKWTPWSQWTMSGGIAVVPEIRGSAVYSPNGDISISSKLGPAWRTTIEGVVPLWTFGKITSSQAAGRGLVEVAVHDIEKTRQLVFHDVRRAFFGLQLAHDARYLLELARSRLQGAIDHAEENDETDESDLLRMKTYLMEIQARLGEIEKWERIATAGLRFLTGVEAPQPFAIPDEPIAPPKRPLGDVLVYLAAARNHRPELKQARAGIEARRAQVDFAKARLYPDIGIGLAFGYSNAPIITDQTNPYVIDNANFLRYGIGVVFRWNLDLLPAAARVRFAEAQLAEMRDTQSFALGGVGVEVETAYATAKDASVREKFYGEAESLSKRWVASVSAAIAIGTKDDKDIIDPLRAFLTNRYNHLQAIMDLDVAISQLSLATGDRTVAAF